ncbi:MAG: hypothetical protein BWY15_00876 [Firmicutes bacterium ADurb.Bin193]|nr:MAG: hypothetical protein BWY15_00876 [Firmicutes bacterium ADurb.Bin193]
MAKRKSSNKIRFTAVLLILTGLVAYAVYMNRDTFMGGRQPAKEIFSFETEKHYRFEKLGKSIIALGNDGMTCVSSSGKTQWNIERKMQNPCIETAQGNIIIFDRNGKDIALYSGENLIWEKKTEQPIITAKVNARGYTAVVTYEIGYKGMIEILNAKGEPVYLWRLGEDYVIDVDISPDCRYFAAATLNTEGEKLSSKITVVDIDGERIAGETTREDSLIINLKYQPSGNIVALGEGELVGVSSRGAAKWAVSFEGRALTGFELPYGTDCVVVFEGSRNNSVVEVYSRDGAKTGEYVSESEITSMDVSQKYIAVAENKNISLLNLKGRVLNKAVSQREVKDIILLPGKEIIAAEKNSVRKIDL